MRVKVLFDKEALNKNLRTGWGVSFLIDNKILFDTGEKGEWLLKNMQILGIGIEAIEAVAISHDHWDHAGGLWKILALNKGLRVYACPHFSPGFKEKVKEAQGELIEADKLKEISEDVFTSGEIPGSYHGNDMPEQALFVKTENGISVITGCAHPGIVKILEKAKEAFPDNAIYSALGGFHLIEDDKRAIKIVAAKFKEMGVRKAGPTHCSGKGAEDIFKEVYGDDFIAVKAGEVLDV